MAARQAYLYGCVLEPPIIELVKLRAPQINGCAFGVDVHWKGAKALGESHEGAYQSRNAPASSN
jgi:AhpD family alkylhydroperoxidase